VVDVLIVLALLAVIGQVILWVVYGFPSWEPPPSF
jgi:hypothetical protein